MVSRPAVLLIACGALAREIVALIRINGWDHMVVQCLPAELHNTPQKIPPAVRAKIRAARGRFETILVAYGDCGTGGLLDAMLAEERVERLPGAHCYEFFAGTSLFNELAEQEPGSFYLTDFLARHFDRLVFRGLGLDRWPELKDMYFGNYRKMVYLAQVENAALLVKAQRAAAWLGLEFDYRLTGYGDLKRALARLNSPAPRLSVAGLS